MDRDPIAEASAVMADACQLLDAVKQEWAKTGEWSAWDQSVRDRLTAWQLAFALKPR